MKKSNRNVILYVDNCRPHKVSLNLTNISLKYLPSNTTSVTQPLDLGIIHSFKAHYRREVISLLINNYNRGAEPGAKAIDLLDETRLINNSLKNVNNNVFINCFRKGLFNFDITTEIEPVFDDIDSEFWSEISSIIELSLDSFEEYVTIDENEQTFEEHILRDEQIIQQIYGK